MKNGKVTISTATLSYMVFGEGPIDLVIEMGLGSTMNEWENIASQLSRQYTVLLYERAGLSGLGRSNLQRTPRNIALELHELLCTLNHSGKITFVAHSQGGLYAQTFARMYPKLVEKLVLIDPLTASDYRFQEELTAEEFKRSGVDKTQGIIDACAMSDISKNDFYFTTLEEYELAHNPKCLLGLDSAQGFPAIEISLITHDSSVAVKEFMEYGGCSKDEAKKIENIWQSIMRECLEFSPFVSMRRAKGSGHYIHLVSPQTILDCLDRSMLKAV